MSEEVIGQLSICEVMPVNSLGNIMLKRIADINNGTIIYPQFYDDEPTTFYNRKYLYLSDHSNYDEGYVGIWEWSATYNHNDPNRDYVRTKFVPEECPMELEILEANSMDEVVALLKDGIDLYMESNKILIGYKKEKTLKCILCKNTDLTEIGNKYILSSDLNKLPVYNINPNDVVKIGYRNFYRKNFENIQPDGFYDLKQPLDIVKEIILKNISWTSMKSRGYVRDTYKKIKNFIESFDTVGLDEKIAHELECSKEEANNYLNIFFDKLNDYINGETFDDLVITSAIQRNDHLFKQLSSSIENEWKKENEEKINDAKNILEEVNKNILNEKNKLVELDDTILKKKNDLANIQTEYEKILHMGDDVQNSVRKKIEKSRDDMASFISEVTFLSLINKKENSAEVTQEDNLKNQLLFIKGALIENDPDENKSWDETLNTLIVELESIGLTEKTKETAAVIYSCFINKYPILLAGPFGEAIANAVSASIDSHFASILDCSNEVTSFELENLNQETIVLVKNIFNSKNKDMILENLYRIDTFFIFTVPFSDELKIESKELLNYMLPIFTEDLFTDKPKNNFVGGICTENYNHFESNGKGSISKKKYKELNASNFVINRINGVISDAKNMVSQDNDNIESYFFMYPIAFMTGKEDTLLEIIQDKRNITTSLKEDLIEKLGDN